jgi:hypothetical protein
MAFMQVFAEFRVSGKLYDILAEGGIDVYLNCISESTFSHCVYTRCVGVIEKIS